MNLNAIPPELWAAAAAVLSAIVTAIVTGRQKDKEFSAQTKDQQLIEIGKLWERVDKLTTDRDTLTSRVDDMKTEIATLKLALMARESDVEALRKHVHELEAEIELCGDVQKHKSLRPRPS